MMPDMKTVMLLYAIINAVCAIFMAVMWYRNRKRYAGIGFWLTDMILQTTGSVLIVLRGIVPVFFSVTIANSLIVSGILIIFIGLERFLLKKSWHIHNYIFIGISIAVLIYFTSFRPNLYARNFDISAITLILTLQCAWLMLRRVPPNIRRSTTLVGIVFCGYFFISAARIILLALFPMHSSDFFKSGAPDTFIIVFYTILSIGLTISLILMINSRLVDDILLQAQQRDEATNKLKETQAILLAAFENSPAGVAIADAPDGKLRYVNNAGLLVRDKSERELVENINIDQYVSSWNILHLDGTPYKPEEVPLSQAVLYGKISSEEFIIRRDSSEDRIVWANAGPVLDENGNILAGVVVFMDITDRKKIETALWESEEKFFKAFQTSPYAITITSVKDGNIIETNEAFTSITGFSKEEISANSTINMNLWADIKNRKWVLSSLKNGIEVKDKEFQFRKKNGEILTGLFSAQIIHSNNEPFILSSISDITERKNREIEITYISFHDKLTGLYNRRFFEEEIKRLDTDRQLPVSIIMGDLNNLKLTNDTFGHQEGDRLLIETAKLLKKVCRSDDILARWGGDEFVILLPKTSIASSEEIVQRILKECSELFVQKIPIGIAIGLAAKAEHSQNIEDIIMEAESNMYKNKLEIKQNNAGSIISALEQALYEQSNETMEHTQRLKELSLKLGKKLKLHPYQLNELSILASLHDIGKVAVPEAILLKEGSLSQKEWEIMKRHPEIGFNIAQSSPQIAHIAKSILSCHENWDSTGYPRGLEKEEIPLLSRIITIADSYDVMTNKSPYKNAMSKEEAVKELERCAGTQFDPVLVNKFIEIISKSSNKT